MAGHRISVVIPVLDGERFIRDAIESVLARTLAPVSAARNTGVAESSGELIAFLDADDPRALDAGLTRVALEEALTVRRFHGANANYDTAAARRRSGSA